MYAHYADISILSRLAAQNNNGLYEACGDIVDLFAGVIIFQAARRLLVVLISF